MKTVNELVEMYGFKPLTGFIRSKKVDCPYNGRSCKGGDECICDSGIYEFRSELVNTDAVWVAEIDGYQFQICEFGSYSKYLKWYSISILETEFVQDENLDGPNELCRAVSSSWNGEKAGSAIPRLPETIRGEMYRTASVEYPDCHIQCDDIVQYLIELAAVRSAR